MTELTWEDVEQLTFEVTTFREGYVVDEVDALLDRLVQRMRAEDPIDDLIAGARFRVIRFAPGYDIDEVDRVLAELAGWEPADPRSRPYRANHRRTESALNLPPAAVVDPEPGGVAVADPPVPQETPTAEPEPQEPPRPGRLAGLTAEDIDAMLFGTSRVRPGYAMADVDDLLARISTELRAGRDPRGVLASVSLSKVRFGESYSRSEVDALLARLRRQKS